MRILIEAHHPAHIHFWKHPVLKLIEAGHRVLLVGRDRDVMKRLLEVYDWIPYVIPKRRARKNRLPLLEFLQRQMAVGWFISNFNPEVVASLMGSYCQSARLLGRRNVIFTDSEFHHFNHRIAHPFADVVYTPTCFYKDLGHKQRRYRGIHELMFLGPKEFIPDKTVLKRYGDLKPGNYILIRLSAWNTFHDVGQSGFGERVRDLIRRHGKQYKFLVSAEENKLPDNLNAIPVNSAPEDFHHLLSYAAFVLTEGASTASEAGCLGAPTVYVNSTDKLGYIQMLENRYGILRRFTEAGAGLTCADDWIDRLPPFDWNARIDLRKRIREDHPDGVDFVVQAITRGESPPTAKRSG